MTSEQHRPILKPDGVSAPAARWRAAWEWLCRSRRDFPANADIWHLRFHGQRLLPEIIAAVASGQYRFSAMQGITRADGEALAIWPAADVLVLKWLTLTLQEILPVHRSCAHVKGHGGHKAAVRQAHRWVQAGRVCERVDQGHTELRGRDPRRA